MKAPRFYDSVERLLPSKRADGTRQCRICGERPGKGRSAYCSEAHKVQAAVMCGVGVRYYVCRRDNAICALCGADCAKIARVYKWACDSLRSFAEQSLPAPEGLYPFSWHYYEILGLFNGHSGADWREHFWEADHIRPVSRGGGASGLDNYRTLCVPCHKAETKKLAAERAAERKARKQ